MDKQVQRNLIIGIIVGIIVICLIGGYFLIYNKGQITKQPVELILSLSDLEGDYSIEEKTPRLVSDVSEEGINLGWKEGYYVRYARIGDDIFDTTIIEQLISIYPIKNITKTLELPREDIENFKFEEMPSPNIGENSRAFRITETDEWGEYRYYQVDFIKENVYENFYMSGTATDYEMLKELAQKAEAKI